MAAYQFFGNNGLMLSGGHIYTYVAGQPGNTKPTYQDVLKTTANTNPIVLNAAGRANIVLDGTYYIEVWTANKNASGSTLVWSQDDVTDLAHSNAGTVVILREDSATAIQTIFADASSGDVTVTLPSSGSAQVIRTDDSVNTVQVLPPDGLVFSDSTDVYLYQKNESLLFKTEGNVYYLADQLQVVPLPTYVQLDTIADIILVENIDALRLIEGSVDGQTVQVQGYYATNDGGGGPLRFWDSASSDADNGATVIKPISVSGAGRWVFSASTIDVRVCGAKGDGVTDDTDAFTTAISLFDHVTADNGTYALKTVAIDTNVELSGSAKLLFFPDYEQNDVASTAAGAAMFDIQGDALSVKFTGLTFDGNEANQNVVQPSASLIRASNISGEISVNNCTFVNQTRASIFVDGQTEADDSLGLIVSNCVFLDGREGIGSGDPLSPNPNGFAPLYIDSMDRVNVQVTGSRFLYRKTLAATGEYAPVAVRWSWLDSTVNEDGASGSVSGCYFYKCGRKDQNYDGTPTGNNGLGVLDFYSRGRNISIVGNTFIDCYNSAIRGKTNIDAVTISANTITNTPKAINIGPPTYPLQRGYVSISGNIIRDTDAGGIMVVGNTATLPELPYVSNVSIVGNVVDGLTNDNPDTGNIGGIVCRYFDKATILGNTISNVTGADCNGITIRDMVNTCVISANVISDIANAGIYSQNSGSKTVVTSNNIKTVGGRGIDIASTLGTDVIASNNCVTYAVDYGIIVNQASSVCFNGNNIQQISGLSRGLYLGSNSMYSMVSGNVIAEGVTTPIFYTSNGTTSQVGNSFNPIEAYRAANPTTGTWDVGDKVWSTNPAATGYMGWVCTVAGTPGTWKTFGAVTP